MEVYKCISSQVRTEKGVEKRLLEHKTKVKEENCFALMFACCGRGKGLYRGKCPRNGAWSLFYFISIKPYFKAKFVLSIGLLHDIISTDYVTLDD